MLTKIIAISQKCSDNSDQRHLLFSHLCEETDRLLKAISCSTELDSNYVDVTMYYLHSTFEYLHKSQSICWSSSWSTFPPRITDLLNLLNPVEDSLIRVAIIYNIVGFVGRHVTASIATDDRRKNLLTYALFPVSSADPSPEMVSCILEAGETSTWSLDWPSSCPYLVTLSNNPQHTPISSAKVDVLELMIKYKLITDNTRLPESTVYLFASRHNGDSDQGRHVTVLEVLERLAITNTQRERLKSVLRHVELAEVFDPRDVESKETKPAKRKQARARSPQKTKRRKATQSLSRIG